MKTRSDIEQNWKQRGFSCGLWTDPPGQVWEDFTHDTDELVILLEGEFELEIEGNVFRPAVGDEVLILAGAKHSVRNVGGTRAKWLFGYAKLDFRNALNH